MSKFYIVATPIGNLQDISLRSLEVFKSVDAILCEDTRVTAKLLAHYKIKKSLIAYHQHSKVNQVNKIISLISEGKDLALVSDAGTPGISDPGNQLIATLLQSAEARSTNIEARNFDIEIIPIPGPSALLTLLSASGLPSDSFNFLGFLPKKKGRQRLLKELAESERTVVFYESGHRIIKALEELVKLIPDRGVVVGRELTKKFETIYRGTAQEVLEQVKQSSQKGEFVVALGSI